MRKQVQYRLLIVRLGAMGDILHALPAVTALRKAHPSWIIDWAIEPKWRALLTSESATSSPDGFQNSETRSKSRPIVDSIHEVPAKAWGKRILSSQTRSELSVLRSSLKAGRYDAVLDLQGAIRSAVIARLSSCRRIIGESHPREKPARWLFTELIQTLGLHVVEQDLELASAIAGDLLTAADPWLPVDEEAEDWCDQHEEIRRAEWTGKPIILIHPGAGWGAKRWPPERFAVVAKEFARRGAVVLVNAGPGEESLAATVAGAAPASEKTKSFTSRPKARVPEEFASADEIAVLDEFAAVFAREPAPSHSQTASAEGENYEPAHATVIQSTLPQLIALTRRSTLVIGGDTGPVHLASALGKPVIGIYGPTDPRRNGPYGSRSRVLRNPESRRDHSRREQTEAGLLTITPEAVIDASLTLMLEERAEQQRAAQVDPRSTPREPYILRAEASRAPALEDSIDGEYLDVELDAEPGSPSGSQTDRTKGRA